MKQSCRAVVILCWLTAPVITVLILRSGSSGSYPFFALFFHIYKILRTAPNAHFPALCLAQFLFWTVFCLAAFLIERRPRLRFLLGGLALADLILSLAFDMGHTALWDMLYITAALYAGKAENPTSNQSKAGAAL